MKRNEFVNYLKQWCDADCIVDIENIVCEIEKQDAEGDFIFENDTVVIGKYLHSFKSGKEKEVKIIIYGIGEKYNITENDYELDSYTEFEYIIL